ncbi:unnamed protein product [Chrysoparadoxa australica]
MSLPDDHQRMRRGSSTKSIPCLSNSLSHVDPPLLLCLVVATGLLSGLLAFCYDWAMEASLELVWKTLPELLQDLGYLTTRPWVYTLGATFTLGMCAGAAIKFFGYPGDLPDVIHCIHHLGYVPIGQTPSMVLCSLFSIAAGCSLGPEAPLVAICTSTAAWCTMKLGPPYSSPEIIRAVSVISAAAGLSAFFGVALGGSLFALEVLHRTGYQYFEVAPYSVAAGVLCLVVYRGLQFDSFGAIWPFEDTPPSHAEDVLVGIVLGAVGAGAAIAFNKCHKAAAKFIEQKGFGAFDDLHAAYPLLKTAVGGVLLGTIGIFLPATMFWSEVELASVADPSLPLPHIFPRDGFWATGAFDSWAMSPHILLAVVLFKLIAISVTVLSGFRGGFIFPLMFTGACLGRAIFLLLPSWLSSSAPVASMSVSAGLNVGITRTPFATALLLTTLSGQSSVAVPVLAASLTALFLTSNHVFIGSQQDREDLILADSLYNSTPVMSAASYQSQENVNDNTP